MAKASLARDVAAVACGETLSCLWEGVDRVKCYWLALMSTASYYPFRLYALSTNYTNGLGIGKVELVEVNPHLRGGRVENHLGKTTPVHPTEIQTSISPSSAVELNMTSALANSATETVALRLECSDNCLPSNALQKYHQDDCSVRRGDKKKLVTRSICSNKQGRLAAGVWGIIYNGGSTWHKTRQFSWGDRLKMEIGAGSSCATATLVAGRRNSTLLNSFPLFSPPCSCPVVSIYGTRHGFNTRERFYTAKDQQRTSAGRCVVIIFVSAVLLVTGVGQFKIARRYCVCPRSRNTALQKNLEAREIEPGTSRSAARNFDH
uniref:Uncharacterized protein n=1 Tax=Timema cristinae TaxID=61476 RepID=A0A7R9CDV8_TIMCR|nr:unnamed protein product [Timema cristinae]